MANEKLLIDLWGVNLDEVDTSDCTDIEDILSAVITYLSEQPTVDAVEVVRCKDCKHAIWDEENEMWKCVEAADYDESIGEWIGFYEYHNSDFYCAYGERKIKK